MSELESIQESVESVESSVDSAKEVIEDLLQDNESTGIEIHEINEKILNIEIQQQNIYEKVDSIECILDSVYENLVCKYYKTGENSTLSQILENLKILVNLQTERY